MFQKHITLAVAFTLATFTVFAQSNLRETLKKHHLPIAPNVERGLQFMEKQEAKSTTAQRGAVLQLDSILLFNAYFDADSTPVSRNYYDYPHPDTTVNQVDTYNNGVWEPDYKSVYATNGLFYTQVDRRWDEVLEDYVPESLIEAKFHNTAKTEFDSLRLYGWNGSDWQEDIFVVNEYNADDRIGRTLISFMGLSIISIFTYDAAGNLMETNEVAELLPGFLVPISKTVYFYEQNRLTEKIDYSIEEPGKPPLETGKTTYGYDAKGNEINTDEYGWNAQDTSWALISSTRREFDSNLRLTVETIERFASDTSRIRNTYAYISEENISLNQVYQWDNLDQKWYLDSRAYYFYSGSVRTVEAIALADLNVFPNPVSESLRLDIPVDAVVSVRDMNGRLIHFGNASTIHFSNHQPGTYIVSAFYGGQWHYTKVVKQNNR